MPATGVLPPALILVAVRAIAPVAGRPPNKEEAILATPCAVTSALGRCFPSIIRSATMADSKDSTPARKAITNADGKSSIRRAVVISGSFIAGRWLGKSPKREWIVSTGMTIYTARKEPKATATIKPGKRGNRSEEHTSELQSRPHLVCRLLLEKKKKKNDRQPTRRT